ncbi:WD repeat-containing protein 78 [Drosophila serrata]|uniref:WD repeat-containing protein 78 n=1 Tax=Drosophila serrata TaxID=7274 RepID=UPI000A1D05E3|nr:WD repeat-containing protein 78 [Drosophila serrata]
MSRPLRKDYRTADFEKLSQLIRDHPLMRAPGAEQQQLMQKLRTPEYRTKCVMRASLDDIALGINLYKLQLDKPHSPLPEETEFQEEPVPSALSARSPRSATSAARPSAAPFIKVLLRKTPIVVLFERRSMTALVDTEEGRLVIEDNRKYDELLSGIDKTRRTVDADTQTMTALMKSRLVNTERLTTAQMGSYVSNFEMYDTYADLQKSTTSVEVQGERKIEVTTYHVGGVDQFVEINSLPGFRLALMLTMRILASNVFEPQQRRYRNMAPPDPLAEDVKFKYRLGLLWRLSPPSANPAVHQAVSDMSFCPSNGDIMAVAYGVYSHGKVGRLPRSGWVYVWNIKNPVNPERCYNYQVPVVTVEFSPTQPQLLAIGLHNGSVEVRDISGQDLPPLAISQRSTSPHFEPVTAIKWIYFEGDVGSKDPHITPFLATSQAGAVTKYRLINSPNLLGFEQQRLQRAEGELEGIPIDRAPPAASLLANRHPQCLELVLDPVQADIYYVLTDEGTLYKCSTNYPLQHLELRQVHDGPAACMEFSPWSPRMYLTCGSDWCIRIWLAGILLPIVTLQHHLSPVHCARWSRTHSTILVSLSRSTVDIWDLRNSTMKPVSSTTIDANIFYTTFKFTHCGRSLAVGNEAGNLLMLSFEDMPFSPHFQYKQLKRAIFKALSMQPDLRQQVKSVGYFGYPGGKSLTRA